jgi:hypothetical protein
LPIVLFFWPLIGIGWMNGLSLTNEIQVRTALECLGHDCRANEYDHPKIVDLSDRVKKKAAYRMRIVDHHWAKFVGNGYER